MNLVLINSLSTVRYVGVSRGFSEVAITRNGIQKAAERALKEDPRYESMSVKIVWESRSVAHVSLPVRKR